MVTAFHGINAGNMVMRIMTIQMLIILPCGDGNANLTKNLEELLLSSQRAKDL